MVCGLDHSGSQPFNYTCALLIMSMPTSRKQVCDPDQWCSMVHTHTHTSINRTPASQLFSECVSVQKYSSEALGYGVHRPRSSPLSPCLQREPLNYTHTHTH